jgi:Glycosyl hydrolase family 79 C-terminal beta domain
LTRSTLNGSTLSTPSLPHIQPQYYAAIIAAEAIGNSGNTQVLELDIDDPRIAGYALYQGGKLANAILINSLAFLTTTTTTRSSTHVNLTFPNDTVSSMNVKRLFVPYV